MVSETEGGDINVFKQKKNWINGHSIGERIRVFTFLDALNLPLMNEIRYLCRLSFSAKQLSASNLMLEAQTIEFHLALYFICAQFCSLNRITFFKRSKLTVFKYSEITFEITKANNLLQLSRIALNYICHIMNAHLNAISNKLISKTKIHAHTHLLAHAISTACVRCEAHPRSYYSTMAALIALYWDPNRVPYVRLSTEHAFHSVFVFIFVELHLIYNVACM